MLCAGRVPQLPLEPRRGEAVHVDDCDAWHRAAIDCVRQSSAVFELYVFILEHCARDHGDDDRGSLAGRDGSLKQNGEIHDEMRAVAQL